MNPRNLLALAMGLAFTLLQGCSSIKSVRVESHPPGARILIDGRDTGLVTPADVDLSTKSDRYDVCVEKAGYNSITSELTLETDVDVMDADEVVSRVLCAPCCLGLTLPGLLTPVDVNKGFHPNPVSIKLVPEGQGVSLTIDPPDAEVYVDGRLRNLLDDCFLLMDEGDHEIEISRDGYRTWRRVTYIESQQYTDLDVRLDMEGQGVIVRRPDGLRRASEVKVLVDGVLRSTRFDEVLSLEPGNYVIEVRLPQREAWVQEVQVSADQFLEIKIEVKTDQEEDD